MTGPVNVGPDIAYREQAIQMEFLRNRILFLAQSLAEATSGLEQALAERDAYAEEIAGLKAKLVGGGHNGDPE
jgi:hypothetical protein